MNMQTQPEQAASTDIPTKKRRLLQRHPFSTLDKVAFWSFLVLTVGAIGGAIALLFSGGSIDIEIFALFCFIATVFVGTGIRWIQGMGSLVGVYLLYLQFVQPFIIESLSNPRGDPRGGFGHFIGNVFTIAINILACAASITAVLQGYRGGSRKTPRWFRSVWGGVCGLAIGALLIGAVSQPAAIQTLTYTNGVPTVHLSAGGFNITSVTISKGSRLLLVDDTTSQHVLANGTWQGNSPLQKQEPGAPLVTNLSLSGNSVTIGPFSTAGTYHILCLIHRGMSLTINVQ
jgi:plastocyanin